MSAGELGEIAVASSGTPPGEGTSATTDNNGTAKQATFNELVEFANEAIKRVTAINARTKNQPEALNALNSLMAGLCTYAAERVITIEGKIEGIHAAIAKTGATCKGASLEGREEESVGTVRNKVQG